MNVQLSTTDLAASIYRASQHAMAYLEGEDELKFEDIGDFMRLGDSLVSQFVAAAQYGESILSKMDGKPSGEIAKEFFFRCSPMSLALETDEARNDLWNSLDKKVKTYWNVIARHILMLLDSDEITDINDAESFWYHNVGKVYDKL